MRLIRIGDFRLNYSIENSVKNVLSSQRITEGNVTREFENKFSKIAGKKYSVAVNSGTSALMVALRTLHPSTLENYNFENDTEKEREFKDGHLVLTTPTTYVADANAIVNSNLLPTFVDIDIPSLLINPDKIKEKIEDEEKKERYDDHYYKNQICGILPVHLFGQMCDMDKINRIAKDNNLFVLEDAAQATGSLNRDNKPAGSFGDISIYSLYVAHNIAAGELGIASTDNFEYVKHMRSLKSNGRICTCNVCNRMEGKCPYKGKDIDPRFVHSIIGYNFKTTDLASSIALSQIDDIKSIIKKRQENVNYLNVNIRDMTDIFYLPEYSKNISYLAYPLILKEEFANPSNCINPNFISNIISNIRNELEKRGIETRPIFPSIPTRQPAYYWLKDKYEDLLPNANYVSDNGFYVGCHEHLQDVDLDYMIDNLSSIIKIQK